MKKVLITLDYEQSAHRVAEEGYAMAKALGASATLLHVVDDPNYYASAEYSPIMGFTGFNTPDIYNFVENLKKEAQRFLEESKSHLGGENIDTAVVEGDFTEAILKYAYEQNVDLIVMGTHGRRGLDKLLMGNLADKVLHETLIPVLVIPTKNFVVN